MHQRTNSNVSTRSTSHLTRSRSPSPHRVTSSSSSLTQLGGFLTLLKRKSALIFIALSITFCVLLLSGGLVSPGELAPTYFEPHLTEQPLAQPTEPSSPIRVDVVNPEQQPPRLPTFHILQPPLEMERKLSQCVSYCAGATPPPVDLEHEEEGQQGATALVDEPFEELVEEAFGGPLLFADLYPQDWPFILRETDQFSLAAILSLRFNMLSTFHHDPPPTSTSADFLYLALDTLSIARCFSTCRHRDFPEGFGHPALRREVLDWVLETVREHRDRRTYPSLVIALSLIDHDYEGNILSKQMQQSLAGQVTLLGIERAPWETPDLFNSSFIQVPYPSTMHLSIAETALAAATSSASSPSSFGRWQLTQPRPYLLTFAGKHEPNSPKSGKGPYNGFLLRAHLADTLLEANTTSTDLYIHFFSPSTPRTEIVAVHIAMAQSRFCLEPPGDSPTRKGFYEAILLGCVPVIFRRGTFENAMRGGWVSSDSTEGEEEIAVVVDEQELLESGGNVVDVLRGISEEVVQKKRETMARAAHKVQYAVAGDVDELRRLGWSDDANGLVLRRLREVMDGAGTVEEFDEGF